jgi:N-acetylneuraminic acid mutarotase
MLGTPGAARPFVRTALRGRNPSYSHAFDMASARTLVLALICVAAGLTAAAPAAHAHTFAWQTDEPVPEVPRFEAQGAVVGTKLYVLGGFYTADSKATTRSDVFDRATGAWTRIADMPQPLSHAGQAVVGGSIYVAGGYAGDHSGPWPGVADVVRYDMSLDQWFTLPPLPAPRGGGALVALGEKLHFFGGTDESRTVDEGDHWELDLNAIGNGWTARAPIPNPRNHIAGVAFQGKACGIGGQHLDDEANGNQDDFQCYVPATDSWQALPSLPRPRGHISSSTFVHEGRVYVVGGSIEGRVRSDEVTMYDPASRTWIARAALPAGRKTPVAGMIGDTLQVATGNGGDPLLATFDNWSGMPKGAWETAATLGVWAPLPASLGEVAGGIVGNRLYLVGEGTGDTMFLDLSLLRWTDSGLAPRPFEGHHHSAEVIGDRLYLFGGLSGGAEGRVQIYDTGDNTWTAGKPMPFSAGSVASARIGGKVYVAGGIVGSSTTAQAAVYDPATDNWQPIAPMPQGRNHAAAATDGTRMYVFGGRGPGSGDGNTLANGFDTVQIYDPRTNSWRSSATDAGIAPLPQARGGMGRAVFYDGEFYVMGGETSTGAGATDKRVYARVDVYNPATNLWRRSADMPTARHGIFPLERAGRIYVAGGGVQATYSTSKILEIFNAPGRLPGGIPPATPGPGAGNPTTPAAAAPPTAPPATSPRLPRLRSVISARFRSTRRFTRVTRLRALKVARGTRIEVRCRGRGCFKGVKRFRVTRTTSAIDLRFKGLRTRRLRPGARLEVRLVRAGYIGLVKRFKVRSRRAPARTSLCLRPGGTRPTACS